eukprot:gene9621-11791_t
MSFLSRSLFGSTSNSISSLFTNAGETTSINITKRWATKKSSGSTQNGRDSNPKFLGLKKSGGQAVIPGNIIIRQRGTKFHPGDGVGIGRDHTIFSTVYGSVKFHSSIIPGTNRVRKYISVVPHPISSSSSNNNQENTIQTTENQKQ